MVEECSAVDSQKVLVIPQMTPIHVKSNKNLGTCSVLVLHFFLQRRTK